MRVPIAVVPSLIVGASSVLNDDTTLDLAMSNSGSGRYTCQVNDCVLSKFPFVAVFCYLASWKMMPSV